MLLFIVREIGIDISSTTHKRHITKPPRSDTHQAKQQTTTEEQHTKNLYIYELLSFARKGIKLNLTKERKLKEQKQYLQQQTASDPHDHHSTLMYTDTKYKKNISSLYKKIFFFYNIMKRKVREAHRAQEAEEVVVYYMKKHKKKTREISAAVKRKQ